MTKELEENLQKLGLTEYESKIISALAFKGPSSATELSTASTVPRTRAYDILNALIHKGWIVEKPGRPVLYELIDFEKTLSSIISSKKAELEEIAEVSKKNIAEMKSLQEEAPEEAPTELFLGKDSALNKMRQLLRSVKKFAIFDDVEPYVIDLIADELKDLKDKGVTVEALLTPDLAQKLRKYRKTISIRSEKGPKASSGLISTDKGFLKVYVSGTRIDCELVNDPGCIVCMEKRVREKWNRAAKVF